MPIYAYRCAACGHAQDVLQKLSDPVLTDCPACGAPAYAKQLTAAGFQLKGSGWYVTDFRGGNNGAKPEGDAAKAGDKPADAPKDGAATPAAEGQPAKAPEKSADKPAAPAPAPAAAAPPPSTAS